MLAPSLPGLPALPPVDALAVPALPLDDDALPLLDEAPLLLALDGDDEDEDDDEEDDEEADDEEDDDEEEGGGAEVDGVDGWVGVLALGQPLSATTAMPTAASCSVCLNVRINACLRCRAMGRSPLRTNAFMDSLPSAHRARPLAARTRQSSRSLPAARLRSAA